MDSIEFGLNADWVMPNWIYSNGVLDSMQPHLDAAVRAVVFNVNSMGEFYTEFD